MPFEQVFLSPLLTGKRFEDHSIPLELLEDFSAFEELVFEVAKHLYLEDNIERQRVPRGFTNGFSLKLASIGEGSAIPKIILAISAAGLFPPQNVQYLEMARDRIILSIDAAETNKDIAQFIPENLLGYFNRIGKRLKDDETIDFSPNSGLRAKLTKVTRKKLVLSSSKINEVSSEATVRGTIPEADKSRQTFTIQLDSNQRILAPLDPPHVQTILSAFDKYEEKCHVLVTGVGRFDKYDKLESFESIEHISLLDPLDVTVRLNEIAKLQDGWLNGEGTAPNKADLQWFAETFDNNFDGTLSLPLLFPTLEGGLQAEWSTPQHDVSLKVHLATKSAYFHLLTISSDEIIEKDLLLSDIEGWKYLNNILQPIVKA